MAKSTPRPQAPRTAPDPLFAARVAEALQRQPRKSAVQLEAKTGIDRHTLRAIANGADSRLTLGKLTSLNNCLAEMGLRLFDKPRILDDIARTSRILFLLPGYEDGTRLVNTTSPWDVFAMSFVRESVAGLGSDAKVAFEIVKPTDTLLEKVDGAPKNSTVVSIGSPRASRVSARMLHHMFFGAIEWPEEYPPFQFVWPDRDVDSFDSIFAMRPHDLIEDHTREFVFPGDPQRAAWVFVTHHPEYEEHLVLRNVTHRSTDWMDYGVVAAQWNEGVLWVVISGMTGPSTEAAARTMIGMEGLGFPASGNTNVVWYNTKTTVCAPPGEPRGDQRWITRPEILGGPYYHARPTAPPSRPRKAR